MSTQFYSSQIKLHFPNSEKSLQFRLVEESESDNLFHDHIQGEDENAEDVQMADHLRPMKEILRILSLVIERAIVEDGLTLDGSFIHHFLVYQKKEQESETITEVVEIASSHSTPLVPPPETPPLSTPKPKEDPKPNPHEPLIPYPSRLKKEQFQALENPTGRADHFVYRIDIIDSSCDKFPIENNSLSGNPTPSSDFVVESPSPSRIPCGDSDSLVEETDTLLSHIDDSLPEYETFCFDIKEKSSGKKSSGSTTTHSDFSLPEYDLFIFDLSIDPFPPANRSVSHHEEFTDELAHIISPPEYDRFYFDIEIDPGEFTRVLKENIFDLSTKGLTINELNDSSLLLSDCDSSLSKEFYEIDLLVSFPSGMKT
ncbi:hypothetical protein Tco_1394590 [Tanacetum coccineum]